MDIIFIGELTLGLATGILGIKLDIIYCNNYGTSNKCI